jgi:hypothetical protein
LDAEGDELQLHALRSELFEMLGRKREWCGGGKICRLGMGTKLSSFQNDASGLDGFLAGGNGQTDRPDGWL